MLVHFVRPSELKCESIEKHLTVIVRSFSLIIFRRWLYIWWSENIKHNLIKRDEKTQTQSKNSFYFFHLSIYVFPENNLIIIS